MDSLPRFGSIYRPGEVTSDEGEKLNIKGVNPEHLQVAIAKLSAPRRNRPVEVRSSGPRVRLGR